MAKKKQKSVSKRFGNFLGTLIALLPALMAAWSAFMSTAIAKDAGLVGDTSGGEGRSKSRKRSTRKARGSA